MASRRHAARALDSAVVPPDDVWSTPPLSEHRRQTKPVADQNVNWLQRQTMGDVMIDPDYFLTFSIAALCPLIIWYHPCK